MTTITKDISIFKQRKSNLELCRIICMALIIAHHCVAHGGALNIDIYPNRYIALLFYPGGKICFVAFLALSTWFLSQQKFSTRRFVKTWLEVAFYSVLFTILFVIISGQSLTFIQWMSVLFPIVGNSHGFASAYLSLYLLTPFLFKITINITKKQTEILLVLLFIYQILSQIIGNLTGYFQQLYSELLLFIFCYFLAFYLRTWPIKILAKKIFTFGVVTIVWIFLVVINYLYWKNPNNLFVCFLLNISGNESSLVNIIGGYCLFFFFNNIKMPTIKWINILAKPTFGILLFHDHNFFRSIVWNNLIQCATWYNSRFFIIHILISVFAIFTVGSIIDFLRLYLLENLIMRWKYIDKICLKFDNIINGGNSSE